jgi:hypothetical protein
MGGPKVPDPKIRLQNIAYRVVSDPKLSEKQGLDLGQTVSDPK